MSTSKPDPVAAAAQVERAYQEEWDRIIKSVLASSRAKRDQPPAPAANR